MLYEFCGSYHYYGYVNIVVGVGVCGGVVMVVRFLYYDEGFFACYMGE